MKSRLATVVFIVTAIIFAGAFAYALNRPASHTDQVLAAFEFKREAAPTPEVAAQRLFLGVSTASPRDFVKHLLLGVCYNEIDVLQDFAEAMHVTQFRNDDRAFTYYEMCEKQYLPGTETTRLINREKPLRVLASSAFDASDPAVKALEIEAASTYSGNRFVGVDVAGMGSDGLEYQTRVVVAQVGDGWYAVPRNRSSKNFYSIADAMELTPIEAPRAK